MNSIEPSKSSRAACRTCKQKIGKGEPRLGVEEEFNMGGEMITSLKWHHLKCGMDNIPEAVLSAELKTEVTSRGKPIRLSDEDIEKIKKFKEKYNVSGMAIQPISEIDEGGKMVNVEAEVLRKMRASSTENLQGVKEKGATVYVEYEDYRSKVILWGEHSKLEMGKGDRIVLIEAQSAIASNENVQFHALKDTKVLINPTEEELEENSKMIELYVSQAWKRPPNKPAEFTYAPSGRASCNVCNDKISMGELKVVKPEYIEVAGGRTVPGNTSYHLKCIQQDENGLEVLHEAASRLDLDKINESHDQLTELAKNLPDSEAKKILETLL